MVLHHPIISRALETLVSARPEPSAAARESWRALHVGSIASHLERLAQLLPPIKVACQNLPPPPADDRDPFPTLRMFNIWGDNSETFEVAFDRFAVGDAAMQISLEQLKRLDVILHQVGGWFEHIGRRIAQESPKHALITSKLQELTSEAEKLAAAIRLKASEAGRDDDLFSAFARAYSLQPLHQRLKKFNTDALRALVAATSLPLVRPNPDTILNDVEFVASQLLARLSLGPARRHVLDRLTSYLEHFAFDDVMLKLQAEEIRVSATPGARAQREAILQDEIDRFIFLEGMFPITHCEAARGELDTLVELYSGADRQRHTPLLIELKQEINVTVPAMVTESLVLAALADARTQAARYKAHVRANTRWADVEPTIVIVHNCERRLELEADDVVPIYLGLATPSHRHRRTAKP